jgi:hypothetical protein
MAGRLRRRPRRALPGAALLLVASGCVGTVADPVGDNYSAGPATLDISEAGVDFGSSKTRFWLVYAQADTLASSSWQVSIDEDTTPEYYVSTRYRSISEPPGVAADSYVLDLTSRTEQCSAPFDFGLSGLRHEVVLDTTCIAPAGGLPSGIRVQGETGNAIPGHSVATGDSTDWTQVVPRS